jgi:ADP-ribose pyrophosphatase
LTDRVLASRVVFEGRILKLRVDDVEASDGHRSTREVVEHPGAVGIVCVQDGELVLVRQYRHATGETLLEIPAGKLDPGEEPAATARRELVEEVGLAAESLEHLASFYTAPGFTDEMFHLYFTDQVTAEPGNTDDGEVIEIVRRPLSALDDLLTSGEIRDSKSLLGLALLKLR